MHNGKINNTRYDDPRKPMKQSNFKVKIPRRNDSRKTIHYMK